MPTTLDRRQFMALGALGAVGTVLGAGAVEGQPAGAESYAFAAIADPHLREDREGEPTGVEKFRGLLARLREQTPGPEFALLLGDIHPEKLEPLLPEIDFPLHVVHGNHEGKSHREMLRAMFPDDFGERDFYSFERGEDLFIALCTAIPGDHVGHLQSQFIAHSLAQPAWFEELLSRREQWRHVFIYGHVPPEELCRASSMCLAQAECRWLHERVAETSPTALFFGHRHKQVDFGIGDVPVYGLRSVNWNSGGEPTGCLMVSVEPAGIDTRFVPTR